jgi:parallel beta helix pectate lyase-like protein
MMFQKWIRGFLVMALLVGALSLTTPAQAGGPADQVIWCPVAVTIPTPGLGGCTAAFSRLVDLVAELTANDPAGAGAIWIGKDYNSATAGDENFVLDGADFVNMLNYPIFVQGGWDGLTTGTLSRTSPSTFDGTGFDIERWTGSVSVRNIQVQVTASTTFSCAGLYALCVERSAGQITLDGVFVNSNNTFQGAYLNNAASGSSAWVQVINSRFMDGRDNNLYIDSNGEVDLTYVDSYNGAGDGVHIDNRGATTFSQVFVTYGQFKAAGGDGLIIYSNGPVNLMDLRAQDNTGHGIYVANTSGSGDVLLQGTNTVQGNGSDGLYVSTPGAVHALHLVASNNGGSGVVIGAGNGVTIRDSGEFDSNNDAGLVISTGGPITASSLTATGNGNSGLGLATTASGQAITLTWVKTYDNGYAGVAFYADGKITLGCGLASGNTLYGLWVSNFDESGAAAGLELQGFSSYLNGTDEELNGTPVVRSPCS